MISCVGCEKVCCNNDSGEIKHGWHSLKWTAEELRRRISEDPEMLLICSMLLFRLDEGVERIGTAMDHCAKRVFVQRQK